MSSTKRWVSETGASRSSRSKPAPLYSEIHTSTKRKKKKRLRRAAENLKPAEILAGKKINQGSLQWPRQSECGADCGRRR